MNDPSNNHPSPTSAGQLDAYAVSGSSPPDRRHANPVPTKASQ
jgi:hypothetical protein